ncbi:hypothetical protein BD779DRAFT_1527416 [Infundibulicybe gibba]|nr:hypothetical protein BD779DRAFT_1527416 [Infundibulicybe gibba]
MSLDAHSANGDPDSPTAANSHQNADVDPQILEALRSKDRIYVLKLGEQMEGLINNNRLRIDLAPATSYQRLLVHRCSAYYKLVPEGDPVSKGIFVVATAESRIPSRRLCELVPAEAAPQPAFKIMRRSLQQDRRSKPQSQAGSVAGEDADLSDVEPSEAGSLGGRSNATGGSNTKRMTIKEREAAYNVARSRIFMGFEEKEKEKDMNASSSSLSLVSGSTSGGGGGSSVDDLEDSISSPATESEWSGPSGPTARDKMDGRYNSTNAPTASSSSRSVHSTAPYNKHINENPLPSYDPSQHSAPPAMPGYQPAQYLYPYNPPSQAPNPPFLGPYTPPSTELYPAPQHPGYGAPYGWAPPGPQSLQPQPSVQQHPQPPHTRTLTIITISTKPIRVSNGLLPHPTQQMPPPPPHMPAQSGYDGPMNGNVGSGNNPSNPNIRNGLGNGVISPSSHSRNPSRPGTGPGRPTNGSMKGQSLAPAPARSAWSYGPGITIGGYGHNGSASSTLASGGGCSGPTLISMRVPNMGNRSSSNGDEASSNASSSTASSSSQRTYTSTSSSHHPLPPRPDWAVGLKPQPTLYSSHARHHDHSLTNSRTMSPISPPRTLNGGSPHSNTSSHPHSGQTPVSLQSADFPPLSSLPSAAEKRPPVVAGAWGNPPSTRSILMPAPGHPNGPTTHVQHPNMQSGMPSNGRFEDRDRGFERPPPKSAELFNPKMVRRPTGPNNSNGSSNGNGTGAKAPGDKEKARGDAVANAILVGQVASMTLGEPVLESAPLAETPSQHTASTMALST